LIKENSEPCLVLRCVPNILLLPFECVCTTES